MIKIIHKVLFSITLLSISCQGFSHNETSTWPQRAVKIIVGFPAGSSPDVLARTLAPELERKFNQPFIVENHPGAGGILGAMSTLKQPNDGHTLLISAGSTFVIDPYLPNNNDAKIINKLEPVASIAKIQMYLVVNAGSPHKDFKSFIKHIQNNPDYLTYGSSGVGSALHISSEMLNQRLSLKTRHIPYQGSNQALQALLANQIDYMFDPGISLNFVKTNKLRLLAIDSPQRSDMFSDTPTLRELGIKNFDANTTHGMYVAKGTPKSIITKLNNAINKELEANTRLSEIIRGMGATPFPSRTSEFQQLLEKDRAKYKKIVESLELQ